MALKLMYITNKPEIAQIAESSGVDRIFVDMEYIGKTERQGGLDSVQNHHTVEDVCAMKQAVESAEVLVRVNPIHEATSEYTSSEQEINEVIRAGADIIMLPYITSVKQVEDFVRYVGGRVKTMPLIEIVPKVQAERNSLRLRRRCLARKRNAPKRICDPRALPARFDLRHPVAQLLQRR